MYVDNEQILPLILKKKPKKNPIYLYLSTIYSYPAMATFTSNI